jgi:hypothetical protein
VNFQDKEPDQDRLVVAKRDCVLIVPLAVLATLALLMCLRWLVGIDASGFGTVIKVLMIEIVSFLLMFAMLALIHCFWRPRWLMPLLANKGRRIMWTVIVLWSLSFLVGAFLAFLGAFSPHATLAPDFVAS